MLSGKVWFACLLTTSMFFAGLASVSESAETPDESADTFRVYIGTYTGGKSKGIYLSELNLKSGAMSSPELVAETDHPSFLAIHPNRKFLYAVNEVGNFRDKPSGALSAFAIDADSGNLTFINDQPSHGGAPCHLVLDRAGSHVLVANYTGGNVAVLAIRDDGQLGETTTFVQHEGSSVNPQRQTAPHAHSINLDAANRFAFVADLGLDRVLIYKYDEEQGTLKPHDPPATSVAPGSGPRHFAFHPNGRFAFVINELLSTMTAFQYDAEQGTLKEIHTISTLPEDFDGGNSTAEVVVHPSGKFVYGSNRGHDSIAIFRVDVETGKLTAAGHQSTLGKTPRNFNIDPTGQFLLACNQGTDTIAVFRIDQETGTLKQVGQPIQVPTPVCVKFVSK